MKGVIVCCLQKLVTEKFGKDKWNKSLVDSGVDPSTMFLPTSDVNDQTVMKVVQAVCKNLDITLAQAADAFGEYWVNVYSQNVYSSYYRSYKTAKEFLLKMDEVHMVMTKRMEDARPPRFTYEWESDNTLVMHYQSHRGLIDFAVGLVKGVGTFYNEDLLVSKEGPDRVRVVFQEALKKKSKKSLEFKS